MANTDFSRYSQRLVQYFWDPIPSNDDPAESPIWCLGQKYEAKSTHGLVDIRSRPTYEPPDIPLGSQESETSSVGVRSLYGAFEEPGPNHLVEKERGWPQDFLDDFEARIWLTYRSNFPLIPRSEDARAVASLSLAARFKTQLNNPPGFTSDTGWGCMIRSGQCLLANALLHLRLGREWRRGSEILEERRILSLFADNPRAPFSVHNFVEHGALACGKHPGEWFGPSATASCIKALTDNYPPAALRIYNVGDGSDVYEEKYYDIARDEKGNCQPTLILFALRLGLERVTPAYREALKASLCMRQSVGIAGGRPSSSHYFVGTQGQTLFYLDPHQTKPAFPYYDDVSRYTTENIESCHTRRLRRIHLGEMDPSMLVAFLIKEESEWVDWQKSVKDFQGRAIIHINHRTPDQSTDQYERKGAIDEVEVLDDFEL